MMRIFREQLEKDNERLRVLLGLKPRPKKIPVRYIRTEDTLSVIKWRGRTRIYVQTAIQEWDNNWLNNSPF